MPSSSPGDLYLRPTADPTDLLREFREKRRIFQEMQTRKAGEGDVKFVQTAEMRKVLQRAHQLAQHHERTRFTLYLPQERGTDGEPNDADPAWVPAEVLREAVWLVKAEDEDLSYEELVAAAQTIIPKQRPQQPNEELQKRLAKLRFEQEQREYDTMTKNVAFRRQAERDREPLSSFMMQAGLGLDMLLMVFAGALIGYYFAKWNEWSPTARLISAAAGVSAMVVVEGVLMVIKFGKADEAQTAKQKRPDATAATPADGRGLSRKPLKRESKKVQ
eukprot:GGOE01054182.1.p3 GENE.GGOE01054182.1~~GGOE01054182.1.p3  ORF type:complete len:275 (+),score=88.98 GGOE01054182.1:1109-1933(+)